MKRIILPLIAATPILAALIPHADAAAITRHHDSLNPRLIGAGKLHRRFNNGVPAPGFKTNHLVEAISASIEESLANALSSGALTLTKTGAGTLILSAATLSAGQNATNFISGSGTLDHSAIILGGTSGGLIDMNGSRLTLGGAITSVGSGTLAINTGVLSGGVISVTNSWSGGVDQTLAVLNISDGANVIIRDVPAALSGGTISLLPNSNGTLIIHGGSGRLLNVGNVNGTGGSLTLNGGETTSPASSADPVPEPGTAMLFALGMLAAIQARRRSAV